MQFVIGGLVCPLRARIPPNKQILVAVKVKSGLSSFRSPQKWFIPSKSQAWTLFEGSLPRGSLASNSHPSQYLVVCCPLVKRLASTLQRILAS